MSKRRGSFRKKTRGKLRKNAKERGKISIAKYMQELNIGDNVLLNAEPAIQKALYYPRFHGKVGVVKGKKGSCYEIKIKDGNKDKILIVHPVHLRRVK